MANNRELGIELTAEDNASKVIEDVADAVERISDKPATVEVEAETREAESRIDRFARELEGLNLDSAKELRIEFRAEALQGEIKRILRQLETLEDPVEIQAKLTDLERARTELEDLADLAQRDYEVEIDVDPKRNAQRAAGDLDTLRDRGEGLQSAVPALRGFTDELGGTAQGAGIASQALADLGDTALIFGERFASGGKLATGLTRIGTALGGLALGGVVIGGAVAGIEAIRGVLSKLQGDQREVNDELVEFQELLANQRFEAAAQRLQDEYGDLIDEGRELGFTTEQITKALIGQTSALGSRDLATAKNTGSTRDFTAAIGRARTEIAFSARDYGQATDELSILERIIRESAGSADALTDRTEESSEATEGLADSWRDGQRAAEEQQRAIDELQEAYDRGVAAAERLATAQRAAVDAEFALRDAQAALVDELTTYQEELAETEEGSLNYQRVLDDVTEAAARQADAVVRVAEEQAEASGETLTLAQRQDIFGRSLLDAARAADGPARTAILNYTAAVLGIPPEVVTDIQAALDRGDIEEAERLLNDTARTREAEIEVETRGVKSAENVLSGLTRDRLQRIFVETIPRWRGGGSSGNSIGGGAGGAFPSSLTESGTPRALASPVEGAEGPAQLNGQTVPTFESRNLPPIFVDARPRQAAAPLTVNVQTTADMRQVDAAIRRWRRINGTGRT